MSKLENVGLSETAPESFPNNDNIYYFLPTPHKKHAEKRHQEINHTLTLKNLRGVKMTPLMSFWNNSRKKNDFSTKFWLMLEYDIRQQLIYQNLKNVATLRGGRAAKLRQNFD